MALASAGAIFCFMRWFEDLGLADEHGADAKTHQEQSTTAVQEIHLALHLETVRVDDGNGNDGNKSVKSVKCRKFQLLFVHQCDTKGYLDENCDLCESCKPPQCACSQLRHFVGGQSPYASKTVTNDDNPRPRRMEFKK